MKTLLKITASIALLISQPALAEGEGNKNWAEEAAVGYEKKANMAAQKGDAESAAIYQRMAQIKRASGAAATQGEGFDWSEYHELNGQLHKKQAKPDKMKKDGKKDGKGEKNAKNPTKKKGNHEPKAQKNPTKQAPGEEFLKTSREFQRKSIEAIKAGDTDKAGIYLELAEIKAEAATAIQNGKAFSWDRYHELTKSLSK